MNFAEFIKKNLIVIVSLGVTLILTVVLLLMLNSSRSALAEWTGEVQKLKTMETSIRSAKFALEENVVDNVVIARRNAEVAKEVWNRLQDSLYRSREEVIRLEEQIQVARESGNRERVVALLARLREGYAVPKADPNDIYDNVSIKILLSNQCKRFVSQLEGAGITISKDLSTFTYGNFLKEDVMPSDDQIGLLQKHLLIMDEIVALMQEARIRSFNSLGRKEQSLAPVDMSLYKYIRYNLSISGDIAQVRAFINSLQQSRYCFIVQKVSIQTPSQELRTLLRYPRAAGVETAPSTTPYMNDPMLNDPMLNDPMQPPFPRDRRDRPAPTPVPAAPAELATIDVLPKSDRLVFRDLATLKVDLVVDYVEFPEYTPPQDR